MAYHLGVAGKPFSDRELVNLCLVDKVKCIHCGRERDCPSIVLSRVSMQRQQCDIALQLKLPL